MSIKLPKHYFLTFVRVLKGVSCYMIVTIRDILRRPETPTNDTGRNRLALLQAVFLQDLFRLLDTVEILPMSVGEEKTQLVTLYVTGVAAW